MDVSMNASATTTFSLHKKQAESEILQKSQEKSGEIPVEQKAGEAKIVEETSSDKQGRIDFYA